MQYLSRELFRYFPAADGGAAFESEIKQHRLGREIVATMLANSIDQQGRGRASPPGCTSETERKRQR